MPGTAPDPLTELAGLIGHGFDDDTLLVRALTHPSFDGEADPKDAAAFERLEFLGDRVLGLVISELLFREYPDSDEGGLAVRFNLLVRKETCARVAESIPLGGYLRMSAGEAAAGGRRKKAILGNACEALIAAIYLDGGLEAARTFIETRWQPFLATVRDAPKDAKTELQEWAQSKGLAAPEYQLVEREGPDHAPTFTIAVGVEGVTTAKGEGPSKRAAQQAAARQMLLREGIWQDD